MKIMCDECKGEILSIVEIDEDGNGQCDICKTTYKIKTEKKKGEKKDNSSLYVMWYGVLIIIFIFGCLWFVNLLSPFLGKL